jgi:hypothetical protein
MNPTNNSKTRRAFNPRAAATGLLASVVLGAMLGTSSHADMYRAATNAPGGVPAQSTITSVTPVGTNAIVCWYGMQGWYSVEASVIGSNDWTSVARTAASAHAWCQTVYPGSNSLGYEFRLNQNNAYVGSGGCAGCHGDKHVKWMKTGHAFAFTNIQNLPLTVQSNCIACHSVGFGQPTGFDFSGSTAHLKNVGCENCHGPAGWHKYSDHDLIRPAVTIAPEVCGGCHDGDHHPTYAEWTNSPHAHVSADFTTSSSGFTNLTRLTNSVLGGFMTLTSGESRQMSCAPCHSGATRMAMLKNYEEMMADRTNYLTLPSIHDATTYAQVCVTCHDPHSHHNAAQLRNPVASTNFYTFFTGNPSTNVVRTNFAGVVTTNNHWLNTTFASQYDPHIQVCAQCHNNRGATWQGTSRPPHHSPQYNIMIGAVQTNYLNGTNITMIGAHGLNPKGCARCHMHMEEFVEGPPDVPAITGHHFEYELAGCVASGCHGSTADASDDMAFLQLEINNKIAATVVLLNTWATNKGPALFGATAYNRSKENCWEFSTRGSLSTVTNAGPVSSNQNLIPDAIKQARFNLYLIGYDGSLGVHNPDYARYLLNDASNKVWQANQP